jgi:hypothetical protein
MMMSTVIMVATVTITAVRATFRLERGLHLHKRRSEAVEHLLNHMVRTDAKNLIANFSGQMPISQMPGKAHELMGIFVPDFDKGLRSGLDFQQSPVFKLQRIPVGHRNCFREVKEDIFALIGRQANAAAMARVEIERDRASRSFLGQCPAGR